VLSLAAAYGSERALKALLDGHANHALTGKRGRTAVHEAAHCGRTGCLRLLFDAGAELDAKSNNGFAPLNLAAQEGHAECCSLLLAMGCDANTRITASGATPLIQAILNSRLACVRVLIPASDLSVTNRQGRNAFVACILTGNLECFELLLPLISDVDVGTVAGVNADGSPTPSSETPLHLACSFGQERMIKVLLHRGASRTARDSDQRTPLHKASQNGHLGCVRQLLGKPGAYKLMPEEVNIADVQGWTPLHHAAHGGHANLCGVLIAGGARLDAVMRSGHTPLMVAQQFHPANTALIDLLAGRGPAHPPGTVCDVCGRPEPEVLLVYCTGCLRARYCGSACAVAAWPAHRADCQRIKAAREERCRPVDLVTL
jgi:ankyrin repeat protein